MQEELHSNTLLTRIARCASNGAKADALVSRDSTVGYSTLVARIRTTAEHLAHLGVQRGEVVGVAAARSSSAVATALGVMAAGAVYLPLDPLYPRLLLRSWAQTAGVRLVIADEVEPDWIPLAPDAIIPASTLASTGFSGDTPASVFPQDLAYGMFTSGSTGDPKGVVLGHAGLVQYAEALADRVGLDERDRCVGIAPLGFSSSIRQLLLPLTVGATVVVPGQDQLRSPWGFAELVRDHHATHLDVTASFWQALLDGLGDDDARLMLREVRRVLFASERLDPDVVLRTRTLAPSLRIWNMYGCTETTGIVCAYEVRGDEPSSSPVPIGTALSHVQVALAPYPAEHTGAAGVSQIVVTGEAVHVGRFASGAVVPSATADAQTGALRSFVTGDLASAGPVGLTWLGRGDRLVKVRGMRVAAEDVEQHLLRCPGVSRAAVIGSSDHGLLCVIQTGSGLEPDLRQVQALLREQLPPYMVPASIAVAADWPVLPNGKTDLRALSVSHHPSRDEQGTYSDV